MASRHRINRVTVCVTMLISFVLLFGSTVLARDGADKFLILHVDGFFSEDFFTELEEGRLPNIASLFQRGQKVRHGLTLYPGGTEIIMTRLKDGLNNSQGKFVGWGHLDRETGKKVSNMPISLELIAGFNRRNRHQFLLGLPGLNHLAGLSLLNLGRIWETQDVAEFYWFHSDLMGHLRGRQQHLDSLRTFDRYLGLAAKRGKLEGVNLVLYSDHGMTTQGVYTVRYDDVIGEAVQDELCYLAYPNIYLNNPDRKEELARKIAEETVIDLAIVRVSDSLVRGYAAGGSFEITHRDGKYAYDYAGEDYFGYGELGCLGTFMSKEEWLRLTKDHTYPAAPPNLLNYLSHPRVGDIVALLNPPKILYGPGIQNGNHAGLKDSDLVVPLLLAGPAFADLEPMDELWLHELYSVHLPMIDFEARSRERHRVTLGYPDHFELVLSPAHRWRSGLAMNGEGVEPWLEHDLYSSFLTRVWLGARLRDQLLNWQLRVEGFLGDLGVSWLVRPSSENLLHFHWRLTDWAELAVSKEKLGVSLLF